MKQLLLIALLALSACTTVPIAPVGGPSPQPSPIASPAPTSSASPGPAPTVSPSPVAIQVPRIHVGQITGAQDADELQMIATGAKLANQVMATPCFKAKVLSGQFTESNGLTALQIWAKLASKPVTVAVDMFTGSWKQNHVWKTIGYEDEPGLVHMNRWFVTTAYMVADNLVHEGEGHSQGFSHYQVKATSVPYRLNEFFEVCAP